MERLSETIAPACACRSLARHQCSPVPNPDPCRVLVARLIERTFVRGSARGLSRLRGRRDGCIQRDDRPLRRLESVAKEFYAEARSFVRSTALNDSRNCMRGSRSVCVRRTFIADCTTGGRDRPIGRSGTVRVEAGS